MGSISMFHDIAPDANGAASNILALLLSAHLIGSVLHDGALDALHGRIAFGFFQGGRYGYVGSWGFLGDIVNMFACNERDEDLASVHVIRDEGGAAKTCLRPMRVDLTFQNLETIRGMIAVDGMENLGGGKDLLVTKIRLKISSAEKLHLPNSILEFPN